MEAACVSASADIFLIIPLHALAPFLASHLDQRYAAFMHRGIQYGFRVGFNPTSPIRASLANMC